jgi:hypothetical protein
MTALSVTIFDKSEHIKTYEINMQAEAWVQPKLPSLEQQYNDVAWSQPEASRLAIF